MPSQLQQISSLSGPMTQSIHPASKAFPPQKKQKMSITQTYYLAHTARGKLSAEASRADHDLRLLVGHANLLDSLMLDLADAEREQERWFNQTVKGARKASEEPKHIQWADTIVEDPEESWEAEDAESSDSDSEYDEAEDMNMDIAVPLRKAPSLPSRMTVNSIEVHDEFDDEYEDEEEYGDLALTRTSSHQPPELLHDSDEESEDDMMPPSPPQPSLEMSERQRQQIATTSFYDQKQGLHVSSGAMSTSDQASFFEEGYYLPQRTPTTMISAY
ncbi:MAG: hypothetical protein M1827_005899 [Pycnora praestabilis]|nr:MAG: hypothetical protein M1827_005899 [Pycnora praestabilis]